MTTTDKRKRSLYFPDNILREMQSEAKRQERSLSWIVQYAWRIARDELMRLPSVGSSNYSSNNAGGRNQHDHDHMDDPDHRGQDSSSSHGHAGYSQSGYPHHHGG